MIKKIKGLSIAVVLLLCLGIFAGCGSSDEGTTSSDTSSDSGSSSTASQPSATAQYSQDFKLNNATGVEIYGVYASPVGTTNWEENIMGQSTLADGSTLEISFASDKKDQYWDLMVTDSSGNQLIFPNLDLFSISEVTLKLENGTATAETK